MWLWRYLLFAGIPLSQQVWNTRCPQMPPIISKPFVQPSYMWQIYTGQEARNTPPPPPPPHPLQRGTADITYCLRPYHVESTGSRPITEVKQRWARLVLGWVNHLGIPGAVDFFPVLGFGDCVIDMFTYSISIQFIFFVFSVTHVGYIELNGK